MPSLFRSPANESIPLKARLKRYFFPHHASNSRLQAPANSEPGPQGKVKGKVGAAGGDEEHNVDAESPDVSPAWPALAPQHDGLLAFTYYARRTEQ
jgi:hypothetical protein